MGLSSEWVKYGLWRFKRYPKVLQELADRKGISLLPSQGALKELHFEVATGYRPCKAGGISADGSFGQAIDIEAWKKAGCLSLQVKFPLLKELLLLLWENQELRCLLQGM
ncbi:hypothetical protein [Methanosarcina horonobensis]|uniref:hypothetical protein n=1 Tax=Methanosarcina horonobensis TaxID=418008 RepID=UPI000AAD83C6